MLDFTELRPLRHQKLTVMLPSQKELYHADKLVLRRVDDAEIVFAMLRTLGDEVASAVMTESGSDGKPEITILWRSREGQFREQLRRQIDWTGEVASELAAKLPTDCLRVEA